MPPSGTRTDRHLQSFLLRRSAHSFACIPKFSETRARRLPRVPLQVLEPAQCLVEDWDGWSESAPWPYPVWDPLSVLARLWRPSQGREWEVRSAGSREPSLEWESRNMKPRRYEGRVKDGGILLSVHSDSSEWTKKAKEILERTGTRIPCELPPHLCHPVA